jgi:hypothetical protein
MLTEPQFNADRSTQLDRVLSHYLQTHPCALPPTVFQPWRNEDAILREPLPQKSSELK